VRIIFIVTLLILFLGVDLKVEAVLSDEFPTQAVDFSL
jgi:hypothetical protein